MEDDPLDEHGEEALQVLGGGPLQDIGEGLEAGHHDLGVHGFGLDELHLLLDVGELTLQPPALSLQLLELVAHDLEAGRALLLQDVDQALRLVRRGLELSLDPAAVIGQFLEGVVGMLVRVLDDSLHVVALEGDLPELPQDGRLQGLRGDVPHGAGCPVRVAVPGALVVEVGLLRAGTGLRGHVGAALPAEDDPLEGVDVLPAGPGVLAKRGVDFQVLVHLIEELLRDDPLMLAGEDLSRVPDLSDVDGVSEELEDRRLVERMASDLAVPLTDVDRRLDPLLGKVLGEFARASQLEILLEEHVEQSLLFGMGEEDTLLLGIELETGRPAAVPKPLLRVPKHLVPDPLGGHLAFKLGEGEDHVHHRLAHGRRGVELVADGDELDVELLEHAPEVVEVLDRAREPVDLRDDDRIHLALPDEIHELPEFRAVGVFRRTAFLAEHPLDFERRLRGLPELEVVPDLIHLGVE